MRLARSAIFGVGIVLVLALPRVGTSDFILRMVISVMIAVPVALGQNLITGFGGMLSMGQAAFYGIGAYTSALLVTHAGVPWPIALVAAGLLACFFGFLLGFPCLRVNSDYLILMTIGFGEIFKIVAYNWIEVTHGPRGIFGIPAPQIGPLLFDTNGRIYYLYLAIAGLCYVSMKALVSSHVGRALIAIREDELAAAAMGINRAYYKILAFAVGSFWAGIAGSMLAHFVSFVGPASFTVDESLLHLQYAILGGLGSLTGSVLGAVILVSLPQVFQPLYMYRMLLSGGLMVALMAWRPQGILGRSAAAATARKPLRSLIARLVTFTRLRSAASQGKGATRDV